MININEIKMQCHEKGCGKNFNADGKQLRSETRCSHCGSNNFHPIEGSKLEVLMVN